MIIDHVYALTRSARWYEDVEQAGFKTFNRLSRTIELNYRRIINCFDSKSANTYAESFNAKIKAFRAQYRGVSDVNFFLFRIQKLFAKSTGFDLDPKLIED